MDETSFSTKQARSENDVIALYEEYAENWDSRFGDSAGTRMFLEKRWKTFEETLKRVSARGVAVELGVGTGY